MKKSNYYRIITHVPCENLEEVQNAVWNAGAWQEGNYRNCGFVMKWKWYFLPIEGANPTIWKVGQTEIVEEYHFECTCHKDFLKEVVKALKQAHPYEEVPVMIHECFEL